MKLIIFIAIIIIIFSIGTLIYVIAQNVTEWQNNEKTPTRIIPALIVSKRIDVQHHAQYGNQNQMNHSMGSTFYYVTFEFENGERKEFRVKNKEYGLLVEQDIGLLTHKGTRYLGFQRR